MPLKKYVLCCLVPLVILLSMTAMPLMTLYRGEEISLRTVPCDPRDIFRGDHVLLSYEINRIELDKFPADLRSMEAINELQGTRMYAELKPVGDYYEVDRVVLKQPEAGTYLRFSVLYAVPETVAPVVPGVPPQDEKTAEPAVAAVNVDYSLDKYFVPENTGQELERLSQRGRLVAKVKVYRGYALVTDVAAEGAAGN